MFLSDLPCACTAFKRRERAVSCRDQALAGADREALRERNSHLTETDINGAEIRNETEAANKAMDIRTPRAGCEPFAMQFSLSGRASAGLRI
eukprot:854758-Prymnesium_polylepis.1